MCKDVLSDDSDNNAENDDGDICSRNTKLKLNKCRHTLCYTLCIYLCASVFLVVFFFQIPVFFSPQTKKRNAVILSKAPNVPELRNAPCYALHRPIVTYMHD